MKFKVGDIVRLKHVPEEDKDKNMINIGMVSKNGKVC